MGIKGTGSGKLKVSAVTYFYHEVWQPLLVRLVVTNGDLLRITEVLIMKYRF